MERYRSWLIVLAAFCLSGQGVAQTEAINTGWLDRHELTVYVSGHLGAPVQTKYQWHLLVGNMLRGGHDFTGGATMGFGAKVSLARDWQLGLQALRWKSDTERLEWRPSRGGRLAESQGFGFGAFSTYLPLKAGNFSFGWRAELAFLSERSFVHPLEGDVQLTIVSLGVQPMLELAFCERLAAQLSYTDLGLRQQYAGFTFDSSNSSRGDEPWYYGIGLESVRLGLGVRL